VAGKQRKRPQAREDFPGLKAAKQVPDKVRRLIEQDGDQLLILRFNQVDVGGPWCLSKAIPADLVRILEAVSSFESMRPREVFKGYPGKDYIVAELPMREARDRLVQLGRDDQDISCLRLSGTGRLFGFRRGQHFHVLWWDPDHSIYPSHKKHT
jgi:hypothetical protein